MCTLHKCNLCTGLGILANVREFPLTALLGAAVDGDIGRPMQLCARDPLCSPRFMPDDVILTCDIDNAGQESTTNDVHHIYKEEKKKEGKDSIPWP